ncbi:unnamed protein product [Owenia fusiformis]|uniref:Uncharacterized protein n=1 Tax=Owenia fusiformis TaxID=6347 RepID=A0A8J1T6I3_OWEFU|nr:unnamed protein product [Owenia fusiformis]
MGIFQFVLNYIFNTKMKRWNLVLVNIFSLLVVHDTATTLPGEQILSTTIESDIQQIKSTINSMNSTLSDLTHMMEILNRKIDKQNLHMQATADNFENVQAQNEQKQPFEQQYDSSTLKRINTGRWHEDELWCFTENDDVIVDVPVGWNTNDRAYKTLPRGLRLSKSTIPNAGSGVFTDVFIPLGTYFGPYEGVVIYDIDDGYNDGEYVFNVYKNWKILFFRDGGSLDTSNWTRFMNCPRDFMELNVEAFQCKENVYFRTVRNLEPGTELLFFYGWEYAEASFNMKQETFCKGYNGTIHQSTGSEWICE